MTNQNFLALFAVLLVVSLAGVATAQSTISGSVTLEDKTSVAGAKVWIHSAGPREGRGFL